MGKDIWDGFLHCGNENVPYSHPRNVEHSALGDYGCAWSVVGVVVIGVYQRQHWASSDDVRRRQGGGRYFMNHE